MSYAHNDLATYRFPVLPKPIGHPDFEPAEVPKEVQQRVGFKFQTNMHARVGRALGVRLPKGESEATPDASYEEYFVKLRRHLYSQARIDHLANELTQSERFAELTGSPAVPVHPAQPFCVGS